MTLLQHPLLPMALAALLLTLLVTFWLLWPLRGRAAADAGAVALRTRVYRERLQELNADLMVGRTDTETYASLKLELDRNLLADQQEAAKAGRALPLRPLALALLLGLPLLAGGLYATRFLDPAVAPELRNSQALSETVTRVLAGQPPTTEGQRHSLQDFVRALQRRVQAEPDNADAWLTLGLGFLQARDMDPAKVALARAAELRPNDLQVVMTYVQASIMAQAPGPMDPVARGYLGRILHEQPDHQGALLMMALGSLRAGEKAQAREVLTRLQTLRAAKPDGDSEADARIAQLMAQANDTPVAASGGIAVEVSVAPELARAIPADATLFIFARAASGPPMPVAVVRRPASGFPVRVTLGDADSLQPDRLLSQQGDLILQAKVSRSGNATPGAGDWVATAVPVQAGNTGPVRLRISEQR